MKIAIYHNLPSGGAKRALNEWVKRLTQSHTIDVYSLITADHTFQDIRPYVNAYHIFDFAPHRLWRSPFGRLNQLQYWRNLRDLDHIGAKIGKIINDANYDVIFLNPCEYTYMPTLAYYLRAPAIYYLHEPFGPTFQRIIDRQYLKQEGLRKHLSKLSLLRPLYLHRLEAIRHRGLKHVNRLLANSEYTRDQIEKAYGIPSTVCYCGVDANVFRPLPDVAKEFAVISVGAMCPRKGFDFLIKSLAKIPLEVRPLLKLVSNAVIPKERAYIQDLASQYKVQLQLLTNLDSQALCLEYNRAYLCVYAPVMEPFGLVPLEAMACGIPVVGVAEGGVQESIIHQHTGLLTDRDPISFAMAVQELLADPDRRNAYGQQGRAHVLANWTWERSTAELQRHLIEVAQMSRHKTSYYM